VAVANQGGLGRILRADAAPRWSGMLARHYDPNRIEQVLRSALAGDHVSQWDLFDLMEDTWPRLTKALIELKRTVRSYAWSVEPWAEDDEAPSEQAQREAAIVSKAIWGMRPRPGTTELGFSDGLFDILDAWAKGVSVLEIEWERRSDAELGQFFAPRCLHWVKPECYAWADDGSWLGLRPEALTGAAPAGAWYRDVRMAAVDSRGALVPIPEDKFIVAICRSRSNHPMAGALLRPLAFWWCAANFASEWFMNFAQVFGLPIRWAEYDKSVPGLFDQVCAMLEQMGSAAWAAFPAGTKIELKEPSKGGTDNPAVALLDRADRQCDLLILGQTLTTDVASSGSRALGDVHAGVRSDVMAAAAEWLEGVLRDQLVRPICRLNWENDDRAPELCGEPERAEDQKANAERDAILLNAGLVFPAPWLYRRHGVPMPQPGEETVGKPAGAAPGPGGPGNGTGGSPMGRMAPMDPTGLMGPVEDPENPKGSDLPQDAPEGAGGVQTPVEGRSPRCNGFLPRCNRVLEAGTKRHGAMAAGQAEDAAATLDDIVRVAVADAAGIRARWLAPLRAEMDRLIDAARSGAMSDEELVRFLDGATRAMPELFGRLDKAELARSLEGAMGAAAVAGVKERLNAQR
jgi:phage gp29-like protein